MFFSKESKVHGAVLYEKINNNKGENQKVFFIHGGVDTEERENWLEKLQKERMTLLLSPLMELSQLVLTLKIFIM